MKLACLLALGFSFGSYPAFGAIQAPESSLLGATDSRGAYQEARVRPTSVVLDYFPSWKRIELEANNRTQKASSLYPPADFEWGTYTQLIFQEGELRSQNTEATQYKQLDETKPYCWVWGTLSFENETALNTGIYSADGVITLVGGESYVGSSGPPEHFPVHAVQLGLRNSSTFYRSIPGKGFNEFGNGANDRGRLITLGCRTAEPAGVTTATFRKAFGSSGEISYP